MSGQRYNSRWAVNFLPKARLSRAQEFGFVVTNGATQGLEIKIELQYTSVQKCGGGALGLV